MLSQIRLYRLFNDFPTNGACSTVCSISSMHEADLTIITNTQARIERKKGELNYENYYIYALKSIHSNKHKTSAKYSKVRMTRHIMQKPQEVIP